MNIYIESSAQCFLAALHPDITCLSAGRMHWNVVKVEVYCEPALCGFDAYCLQLLFVSGEQWRHKKLAPATDIV